MSIMNARSSIYDVTQFGWSIFNLPPPPAPPRPIGTLFILDTFFFKTVTSFMDDPKPYSRSSLLRENDSDL